MKQISIRQPWASLIASGRKSIELRTWSTRYRGPLLVVSSARPWDGDHGFELGPLGVTVCAVELVEVRPATEADAEAACIRPGPGHMAWVLRNPRPLDAVPVKGALGLRDPAPDLLAVASRG